jgi:hypothetical protein
MGMEKWGRIYFPVPPLKTRPPLQPGVLVLSFQRHQKPMLQRVVAAQRLAQLIMLVELAVNRVLDNLELKTETAV